MTRHSRSAPLAVLAPAHTGPVSWQRLLKWLHEDGVISAEESERTAQRCSHAESAQPALERLASVGVVRASDGAALDVEELTRFLARRAQLEYLRIDPLKVDAGKVADSMSASYAERHKVLPVQVTAAELVVATSEPFITDWVGEVERQARRSVRRVVASPAAIRRYTAEFFALARSVRAAQKSGGASGTATPISPRRCRSRSIPTSSSWRRIWASTASAPTLDVSVSANPPASTSWEKPPAYCPLRYGNAPPATRCGFRVKPSSPASGRASGWSRHCNWLGPPRCSPTVG